MAPPNCQGVSNFSSTTTGMKGLFQSYILFYNISKRTKNSVYMLSEQKDLNRCLEPVWRKMGFNLKLVELLLQIKLNWSVIFDLICKIYSGTPAGGVLILLLFTSLG
ncbi:hypothetical protein KIL84_000688 [Mauremys mutica]|uniref:Uncharacterized protein n=1 Tax=Mauremys mutica TaxID=74926 RepID=A0A9D3WYL4_9SAUR|nr:hypothetical protein KIL84_000688 [Mauremys mutica]